MKRKKKLDHTPPPHKNLRNYNLFIMAFKIYIDPKTAHLQFLDKVISQDTNSENLNDQKYIIYKNPFCEVISFEQISKSVFISVYNKHLIFIPK